MSTPHAPALNETCEHCGQVHTRCIGHRTSKTDGHVFPCGRINSDGHQACYTHGGPKTSQARQRARRSAIAPRAKAMTEVLATLNALGVQIETDPLDALMGQLRESAGIVAVFREHLQQLRIPNTRPSVAEDGSVSVDAGGADALWGPDHTGDQAAHILLSLFNDERERFAKLAEMALRAGVAERQVRVLEQQAAMFADLLRRVLDNPDLGLSPEQRQRGRQIAATELRLLPA